MESKPSTNTVTSTEQDPMPSQQSAFPGKNESDETPTSSTPNPAPTSVVQKYVTDTAEIVSATPAYRKMFIAEVFRKYNEITQGEKESGKTSSELPRSSTTSRKLPAYAIYQNYSDGKFIPAGQNKVLDKLVNNYSIPKSSTSPSWSSSTVTVSLIAELELKLKLNCKTDKFGRNTKGDEFPLNAIFHSQVSGYKLHLN